MSEHKNLSRKQRRLLLREAVVMLERSDQANQYTPDPVYVIGKDRMSSVIRLIREAVR